MHNSNNIILMYVQSIALTSWIPESDDLNDTHDIDSSNDTTQQEVTGVIKRCIVCTWMS